MKIYIVTILESARIEAVVCAENIKEARIKANRGDYDKDLNTAIQAKDKIESVILARGEPKARERLVR